MAEIEVKNLKKYFKRIKKGKGLVESFKSLVTPKYEVIKAVDDISFNITKGEIVAFLGPNGAGKTTTLKILTGIIYPTSGEVSVMGSVPFKRQSDFQKKISIVMGQKNQLWWDLPAIDTFELHKEIYEIKDNEYNQRLKRLTDLLNANEFLTTQVKKLSLGQRMKCELIASLIHNPEVIFLDEPTIGLDIHTQIAVRKFLKEYNKETNCTIMLTSHNMGDVKEMCKRAIIIDHGHKVFDGGLNELVNKYVSTKNLKVTFEEEIRSDELKQYGDLLSYKENEAILSVPIKTHTKIASEILTKYKVGNIDIEEVSLEEVITKIY